MKNPVVLGVSHRSLHDWAVSLREAIAIQETLREQIVCEDRLGPIRHVAGVDVGVPRHTGRGRAAVAVLELPGLHLVDRALSEGPIAFPYVPGLLSFRELPLVLEALSRLSQPPDLLLCDGQGYAHPRRIGLASHLGLLTDLPSIGVAKSRYIGEHGPVPEARGDWTPLRDQGERIGAVLRSRSGVAPIFISIGHRVGLETAIAWVMTCTTRYRLPETTRWAHRLASGNV